MTFPAKSAPIRYIRDRETDARWVSAEEVDAAVGYAEIARLRITRSTVSLQFRADGKALVHVDWSYEPTPNPGRRTPRPGGTQPESERKRQSRGIRLSAAAWLALDALADRWGVTRSAVVERLVLEAIKG